MFDQLNLPTEYFERLVLTIDPFGHNKVSFSDCIHFMTNELIEIQVGEDEPQMVSIIQRINLVG